MSSTYERVERISSYEEKQGRSGPYSLVFTEEGGHYYCFDARASEIPRRGTRVRLTLEEKELASGLVHVIRAINVVEEPGGAAPPGNGGGRVPASGAAGAAPGAAGSEAPRNAGNGRSRPASPGEDVTRREQQMLIVYQTCLERAVETAMAARLEAEGADALADRVLAVAERYFAKAHELVFGARRDD